MAIYSGFTYWKWWFSIAMLVYQRVYIYIYLSIYLSPPRKIILLAETCSASALGYCGTIPIQSPVYPLVSQCVQRRCSKVGWWLLISCQWGSLNRPLGARISSHAQHMWNDVNVAAQLWSIMALWIPVEHQQGCDMLQPYIYICINQTIYIYTYKRVKYWTSPMS